MSNTERLVQEMTVTVAGLDTSDGLEAMGVAMGDLLLAELANDTRLAIWQTHDDESGHGLRFDLCASGLSSTAAIPERLRAHFPALAGAAIAVSPATRD
jgi:hypothetical protein